MQEPEPSRANFLPNRTLTGASVSGLAQRDGDGMDSSLLGNTTSSGRRRTRRSARRMLVAPALAVALLAATGGAAAVASDGPTAPTVPTAPASSGCDASWPMYQH